MIKLQSACCLHLMNKYVHFELYKYSSFSTNIIWYVEEFYLLHGISETMKLKTENQTENMGTTQKIVEIVCRDFNFILSGNPLAKRNI